MECPQLEQLMAVTRLYFKPGYNRKVRGCRLTLDKLDFVHRPLILYLIIFACQAVGSYLLRRAGFQR